MSADEQYLDLLAVFHYVMAALMALFSCFPLIYVAMGLAMVFGAMGQGPEAPPVVFGLIFAFIGALICFMGWTFAVLLAIAGRKLQTRRHRMFCLVIAAIECLLVPHGTILGVFTIVVLQKEPVMAAFARLAPFTPSDPVAAATGTAGMSPPTAM